MSSPLAAFFEAFDILNRNADSFPIFERADYVGEKIAIAESVRDRRPAAVFSIMVSYCLALIIVHFWFKRILSEFLSF